jgi:hypothetical protein
MQWQRHIAYTRARAPTYTFAATFAAAANTNAAAVAIVI